MALQPRQPSFQELQLSVADLKLDELNFRTDEVDSQRAAIRVMLDEQGNRLAALAAHIVNHGLFPGERLLVIPDDLEEGSGQYVVMEGNRRTTALKLLNEPALAAGSPLQRRFSQLAGQYTGGTNLMLPCVLMRDRETALEWVGVKHGTGMGGAGVEKWKAPQTDRYTEYISGKVARWRATLRFLEGCGLDVTQYEDGISGHTTAVTRVLGMGAMRGDLGVRFKQNGEIEFENGDAEAGATLLASMMEEMASERFNTNVVHSFEARLDFVRSFIELSVKHQEGAEVGGREIPDGAGAPDQSQQDERDGERERQGRTGGGERGGSGTSGTGAGAQTRPGVRRNPRERKTLASKVRAASLSISDGRLNQLYHEARRINVESQSAVAAVLIRVFLELSLEHYLITRNVPVPDHIARRGGGRQIEWHTFGVKLREKLEQAVGSLAADGNDSGFDEIRRGLGSQDHLHSPENLHAYVHGLSTVPSASDLIVIWDRYHPLFSRIFNEA